MTKPEKMIGDDAEELPVVDVPLEEVALLADAPLAAAAPVVVKRQLGVKEPIIFKWKLIGHASGMALTLFKAVEREEIDAQFERLTKDGYYTGLQILDIDAKVVQPTPPKPAKKPIVRAEPTPKPAKTVAGKPVATKRAVAAASSGARRTPVAKTTLAAPAKPPKKKATGAKPSTKRPVKKK